jgi:proteasome lid subunit RPN8/RPN11
MNLTITPEHDDAIRRHGERIFPHECCGFLLGKSLWEVEAVVPATNAKGEEEAHNRFVITEVASLRAEKEARSRGLSVIGHYHSHPNSPARPSQGFSDSDLSNATWPGYAFVIVSVMEGKAEELTCWNLADDRSAFEPVPVTIAQNQENT